MLGLFIHVKRVSLGSVKVKIIKDILPILLVHTSSHTNVYNSFKSNVIECYLFLAKTIFFMLKRINT